MIRVKTVLSKKRSDWGENWDLKVVLSGLESRSEELERKEKPAELIGGCEEGQGRGKDGGKE